VPRRSWVDVVNEQAGVRLTGCGEAAGGETAGAVYVGWPDGHHGVVTRSTVGAARTRQTAAVLLDARAHGLPVPLYELVVELPDQSVLVLQERLPGEPIMVLDGAAVTELISVNERFAGLLAGRYDVPVAPFDVADLVGADLGSVSERFPMVAQHSRATARLVRRIQQAGALTTMNQAVGDDLVHPDLTSPNVLFGPTGTVTGVVDWNEGVYRGDRHGALVKLLFDATWDATCDGGNARVLPDALTTLETHLRSVLSAPRLRSLWAYWTLSMLDWTIRSDDQTGIRVHLDLGEREFG